MSERPPPLAVLVSSLIGAQLSILQRSQNIFLIRQHYAVLVEPEMRDPTALSLRHVRGPIELEGFVHPTTLDFWVSIHIVGIWIGRYSGNFADTLSLDIQLGSISGRLVFSKKENVENTIMYRLDLQVGGPPDPSIFKYAFTLLTRPDAPVVNGVGPAAAAAVASQNSDMVTGRYMADEEI